MRMSECLRRQAARKQTRRVQPVSQQEQAEEHEALAEDENKCRQMGKNARPMEKTMVAAKPTVSA